MSCNFSLVSIYLSNVSRSSRGVHYKNGRRVKLMLKRGASQNCISYQINSIWYILCLIQCMQILVEKNYLFLIENVN